MVKVTGGTFPNHGVGGQGNYPEIPITGALEKIFQMRDDSEDLRELLNSIK